MAVRQIHTTRMMVMMCTWPAASKDAAMFMMKKYGSRAAMRAEVWFQQLPQLFLNATIIDEYAPFQLVADSALEMAATTRVVKLDEQDKVAVLQVIHAVPASGCAAGTGSVGGHAAPAGGAHTLHRDVCDHADGARRDRRLRRGDALR